MSKLTDQIDGWVHDIDVVLGDTPPDEEYHRAHADDQPQLRVRSTAVPHAV